MKILLFLFSALTIVSFQASSQTHMYDFIVPGIGTYPQAHNVNKYNFINESGLSIQDQKRSVAFLLWKKTDNSWVTGSAVLVNNVKQDGKKYLLTIYHNLRYADTDNVYMTFDYEHANGYIDGSRLDAHLTRIYKVRFEEKYASSTQGIKLIEIIDAIEELERIL